MKYGMLVLLAGGLLLLGGCQNKELIQCQADKEQLTTELEQHKASISELMDMTIKDTEEMAALREKADADLQAAKEAHRQDMQKLDNSIKALLKTEGEKKEAVAKAAELEKSLANAADMAKAQADENAKLKARIAELEKAVSQAGEIAKTQADEIAQMKAKVADLEAQLAAAKAAAAPEPAEQ